MENNFHRLAAMYTNAELEAVRDRKDKIQSRLFCKMILSLAEPVPETLRGHFSSLATLFKCSKYVLYKAILRSRRVTNGLRNHIRY